MSSPHFSHSFPIIYSHNTVLNIIEKITMAIIYINKSMLCITLNIIYIFPARLRCLPLQGPGLHCTFFTPRAQHIITSTQKCLLNSWPQKLFFPGTDLEYQVSPVLSRLQLSFLFITNLGDTSEHLHNFVIRTKSNNSHRILWPNQKKIKRISALS